MTMAPPTIHGTCVFWLGCGVLITGPSGGGKSQLALSLMGEPLDAAELVADDRVIVQVKNQTVIGSAPAALRGRIERFGMGIETHDVCSSAVIQLVVELVPRDKVERMPDPSNLFWQYDGIRVPKLVLPTQPINPEASIRTILSRAKPYSK